MRMRGSSPDNFDNYDFLGSDIPEELKDVPEYSGSRSLMNLKKGPNVGGIINEILNKIMLVWFFVVMVVMIVVLTIISIPVCVILWLISGIFTIGEEVLGGFCGKS